MSGNRKKLWEPSDKWIKNAEVTHFIEFVNKNYKLNLKDGKDLYRWSVNQISDFWDAIWKFCKIISSIPYDKVVEDLSVFPGTKWF
ncbi:MAG: acetoacetate--CoA ligase, partial [Promethearchaeota archaeon]